MNKIFITFLLLTFSISIFANQTIQSLPESEAQIDLSQVTATQVLAENKSNGRKVLAVVVDGGLSTDLNDRFTTYLVFQQYREMLNIRTAFKLGKSFTVPKLSKIKPGIYSFSANAVEGNLNLKINTLNLYSDLAHLESTLGDFEDSYLNTSIELNK